MKLSQFKNEISPIKKRNKKQKKKKKKNKENKAALKLFGCENNVHITEIAFCAETYRQKCQK